MMTRYFLPNPDTFLVHGFARRWWWRIRHPRARFFRLDDYVRVIEAADAHNHEICVQHIHRIDRMSTWIGENLYPGLPLHALVKYLEQIQAGYTTVDGKYPWDEEGA